jgi:hypothetical protein
MGVPTSITQWRDFLQSISGGSQIDFESALTEIHAAWHRNRSFKGWQIGFLCFHHEMVGAHNTCIENNGGTTPPAWRGKNDPPGLPEIAQVAPGMIQGCPSQTTPDSILQNTDPVQFSNNLEHWHDCVHMNPAYPADFMDPRMNVYMYMFWCWHRLIDDYFIAWCDKNISYDDILSKYADTV